MKNLVVLALVIVSTVAFAKTKVSAEAKKAAKEACMTENKDLKGKDLKKCVSEKLKAAPAATEAAAPAAAPATK